MLKRILSVTMILSAISLSEVQADDRESSITWVRDNFGRTLGSIHCTQGRLSCDTRDAWGRRTGSIIENRHQPGVFTIRDSFGVRLGTIKEEKTKKKWF